MFAATGMRNWISFHIGAPFTDRANSNFALGNWSDLAPITAYPIGTSEYPDRSATPIVEMDHLTATGAILKGQGIQDSAVLSLLEPAAFKANHRQFSLGLDFLFTCGD